jgi:ABC-type antimicrobial peptide transport system permease subunit
VSDVRYRGIHEVQLDVYDPALQASLPADNIVIRASTDPLALAAPVRALARQLDSTAIVDSITTMETVVARAQAPWRLTMWLFVLFAALAFGLAALGLFSVVALDVAHRGREFAIRMALGESRDGILRGVLVRAGWRVLAGVTLGFATAVGASRGIRALLFGVAPLDGLTYAMVLALVVIAVAAAAYVPARRAAAADPQTLLRHE